eukprot:2460907-Heterocapsa_arctica.AAC.1
MGHELNFLRHEVRPSQRQARARRWEANPFRPRPERAHNRKAVWRSGTRSLRSGKFTTSARAANRGTSTRLQGWSAIL